MIAHIDVRTVVNYLSDALRCSNRVIASLIGINESTISGNLDKQMEELITKKTGRRLSNLAIVVSAFYEKGLKPEAILEIMNIPIYPDLDGNRDSIKSAIVFEKYPANALIQIGELAYIEYQRKNHDRNQIAEQIKELLAV